MRPILFALILFSATVHADTFNCVGTEPFWNATVTNESITLSLAKFGEKDEVQKLRVSQITSAEGISKEFLRVYSQQEKPVAVLQKTNCSDDLTDELYSHEVYLFLDQAWERKNVTLYGCCKR